MFLEKKISVIVPLYNKERYIRRAINSILNQSLKNFEVIIVCDPSTDNSDSAVKRIADSRIRILHRRIPGPGGYAARNLGIKEANSEWIAFLDADDEWFPEHLETHLSIIQQTNSQVVASCWKDIWPDGSEGSSYTADSNISLYDFSQSLKELLCRHKFIHTNTITIKRSLFDKAGFFPAGLCKRGGDIATWLRVLSESDGLAYLDKETAIYHRDASTVTREVPLTIETDCIYRECLGLQKKIPCLTSEIMKVSNKYILYGLADRLKKGLLTPSDMKYFYTSENKKVGWGLTFFSFMPPMAQKKIYELLYGMLARIGFLNKKLLWK